VRHSVVSTFLRAWVGGCVACGGNTATPPSSLPTASGDATVTFDGLKIDAAPFVKYTESGFKVTPISGDWTVRASYGNPAPFIEFWAQPGATVAGEIQVAADGSRFYLKSVNFYSSSTPVPYTIKGLRDSITVFTLTDTLPNTLGNFMAIANQYSADVIDTLSITLTNSTPSCCRNRMGLDNIMLTSKPTTSPARFSLDGQVTDSVTGAPISGAAVSIVDGPNAGKSTRTEALGTYSFIQLEQSGFTVQVSAANYLSESKGVTLTSNQTLAFRLMPQAPTPVPTPIPSGWANVTFSGLTAEGTLVTSYSESSFTVSASSGEWIPTTIYGNPPPFIHFFANPATVVKGEIRVAAAGSAFRFRSVDLYSSTTPIPYVITGVRDLKPVFALVDTLPNTFGRFGTVVNPKAPDLIDTLMIVLNNTAPSCSTCRNSMGVDNIVLQDATHRDSHPSALSRPAQSQNR
jgi:hypothetical protein